MEQAESLSNDSLETSTNNPHTGDSSSDSINHEWFIALPEQVIGPYNADKIKQMFEDCEIDGLTSVWRKNTDDWVPLGKDDILKTLIGSVEDPEEEVDNSDKNDSFTNFVKIQSDDISNYCCDERNYSNGISNKSDNNIFKNINFSSSPTYYDDPTTREMIKKIDTEENESKVLEKFKKQQYLKRRRERIERGEFVKSKKNYSVYITGLPKDVTSDELKSVFCRAGVIKIDPITTLPKVKIYRDDNDIPKGDATITFLNRESVPLCLKYFDDYYFRPDVKIHVEEAQFKPNPNIKMPYIDPKIRRKKFLAAKYEAQRIASWGDDMDDGTGRRIVIARPMFSLEHAQKYGAGDEFYETLKLEIYEEVSKFAEIDKITPIPRHPQGIVCLKFKTTKDAEVFIATFKDRMFDGNKLVVYFYDGKTDLSSQCLTEPETVNKGYSDSDDDSDDYDGYYDNDNDEDEDRDDSSDDSLEDKECTGADKEYTSAGIKHLNKIPDKSATDIDDYLNKLIE